MAEAIRKKESTVLKKYKDIDSLPVVNDPLPPIVRDIKESEKPSQEVVEHQIRTDNSPIQNVCCQQTSSVEIAYEESNVATESPPCFSYSTLSSALVDCNFEAARVEAMEQSTAPPLMTSFDSNKLNYEYTLPRCYSSDELKNFYSNQSANTIEAFENEFLEEACCDNVLPRSEEIEDLILEPFIAATDSYTEHPLLRLVSTYAGNLLLWKSTKENLNSMTSEISSCEEAIWKIRKQSEILTGKCRDDYEVSYKLEFETAEFDRDQLDHLDLSQTKLRKFLLDQVSMISYRVTVSRLEIESYLNQVLKQCPNYENLSSNEPIILLPNIGLDEDLDRQIKLLRSITSVLFTCLKQLAFIQVGDHESVPHFELIDNIIEWIICITGRFVRQCRLQDHVFIEMHLLRVPFSVSYTPRSADSPPLCALLQPPALDMASFRVEGNVLDLLSEPEFEVRGTLLALCLKNPKKRFNFKLWPHSDAKKLDAKTKKYSWTVVDSDGESDAECSITSTLNLKRSSMQSLHTLQIDMDPEFVSVESVSALIDQIDILGLIDFVIFRCEGTRSRNDHISLLAFANWLIATLEKCVDFLHRPTSEYPCFQRQIVKQIVEMIDALLSGLRLSFERSVNALSSPTQSSIYPNLHTEDLNDFKIVLAQYDELCLRVTNFILSNATSMTTRLTCWRRFSRTMPLKLFSSRSKLKFFSLLLSSISPEIEDTYVSNILSQTDDISLGVDETVTEKVSTNTGDVITLLRTGLIDNECLAEPFFTVLGQLAYLECRPPPPLIHENEQNQLCLPNDIPVLEKKLVERILEILFELCVVPEPQLKNEKHRNSIPISSACGRAQIVSIISAHPPFGFRHLLDLILTATSQLDTKASVSTRLSRRPDFESSADLLFDLVDALPSTLFTPKTCDLETLLSWIGGNSNGEIPPLSSLRCRIARKLLTNFSWEAVNNATGEYLITPELQTSTAVGIATAFQRHIVDAYHQTVSRISETLHSYARSVWTKKSSTQRSKRNNSISPIRILSSNTIQPPLPVEQEAASFYHWAMQLILRFHLEPSTEDLTRLLNGTEIFKNSLTTFLVFDIRPRQQRRLSIANDEDSCLALVDLANSGHFALAIEAFSRLSIYHGAMKKHFHAQEPCSAFNEFVSILLSTDQSVVENSLLMNFLWGKWRRGEIKIGQTNNARGPIVVAFLGATLNACIGSAGDDENHSLLQALISSILLFLLKNRSSPNLQAIWMLENLLKAYFWIEKSFSSTSKCSNKPTDWWKQPILKVLQWSSLKKIMEECSATSAGMVSFDKTTEGISSLLSQKYRLMSSSWSEGLSSLIPSERLQQYIPYLRLSGSGDDGDSADIIGLTLIQDILKKTTENDIEALWLISYLIGAEFNADSMFGGYSLWDDVMDSITWNRATVLTDTGDPEMNLLSIFINGGILQSGAGMYQLGRVTRRLPPIQAISVLTVCPLHHPAFFLLLQFVVMHCLAFSRANDRLSISNSEPCLPPGFLLLRTLQWSGHNITADQSTNARMTVLEVLICRLREALRFWLQKDSQDDADDPYGLRSSNAISLLRNIISLLTDLQLTVAHGISDAMQVNTLVERIKSLDVKSALQSVNLDAIATTIYTQIDQFHFLRSIHGTTREKLRSPGDKVEKAFDQSPAKRLCRRLDPPLVQQFHFDESSIYGPEDLLPHEWYSLIQTCLESLKTKASMSKDRDTRLERLYRKLLDSILPNLYRSVKCHQSEVVECHPYIQIPLISTRVCKGGARIVHDYEASRLETSMEKEVSEINRTFSDIINEALNSAEATATVSCRQSSTELLQRETTMSNWSLAAFRMVALIHRIVASQKSSTGHSRDESGVLIGVFHLLTHSTTAVTYAFPPVRGVLLQCIWIISEYLLYSGEFRYAVVLDALTSSPQLLQLLSKLWPHLLEASVQAQPESRVKHFMVVYRRLPLILQQCGANVAYHLLIKFPPLPGEMSESVNVKALPNRTPACFGGAAQLDSLIVEAFHCLTTIRETSNHSEESTKLIEFIRVQIIAYLQFNFPYSTAHLLENCSSVKSLSAQDELWYLTKASISVVLSHGDEYSLTTDDMKKFFDKVNKCATTAYSIRDLPPATKSEMIECLGILIQQLAVKLSLCVELDHLSLQQGLNILVGMVLNSLWSVVIGLTASPTNEVQKSAAEQLFTLTANLYTSKESSEPPQLLNAFLDFLMTHLFCNSHKHSGARLLDQLNQVSLRNLDPPNLPEGFPWAVWQPATYVIKTLTQVINGLSRSDNELILLSLSYVLSRVNYCNLKTDIFISDHMENIVALVIAVVCCYDTQENNQDTSSISENMQIFIKNCCQYLAQHGAFVRLVSANFAQLKLQLRPNAIINISDGVFSNFFRFLSIASHIGDANVLEETHATSDIVSQRHAYINLCVDFLLAVTFPGTLTPAESQIVEVIPAVSSEPPSTASRAYSLVVNNVLPVASTALGQIVNTVSSSSIWKHVFGEKSEAEEAESVFTKLIETEGPVKDFALRILGLLYNVENCCAAECWSPVESQDFQAYVSCYGELLRLRSVTISPSGVVDATFIYWISDNRVLDVRMSAEPPQRQRVPGHCRPLLQALLFYLSTTSMSLSVPDEAVKSKTFINLGGIVNLIDTCLWVLLQSNPKKNSSSSFPTTFETRMLRISEIIEFSCIDASEETSTLANCGSWLVPACLSYKKLLPLFVYANARWGKIVTLIAGSDCYQSKHNRRTSIYVTDTPAILLADIMHWFAVLNLQPSDVFSENCSASSQLSGLLLLFNLNMRLISSMGEDKNPIISQEMSRASSFLNYLQNLIIRWEEFAKSSLCLPAIVNFIKKFNIMSQCVLGLIEEWCSNRGSDVTTRTEDTEAVCGLERLRKIACANSSNRDTEHESVAAVRSLLTRLHNRADVDDLFTSYNLLCQRLWSPLPPVLSYLFSLPSTST